MLMRWQLIAVASVGLAISTPSHAAEPKAETPEDAVKQLVAASRAGDTETALSLMAEPYRGIMEFMMHREDASNLFRAAVNKRFGEQPRRGFSIGAVREDLTRIQSVEVLGRENVDDSKVRLRVRETNASLQDGKTEYVKSTYIALKTPAGWRLMRPCPLLLRVLDRDTLEIAVSAKGPDGMEIHLVDISSNQDLDTLAEKAVKAIEDREKGKLADLRTQARKSRAAVERVAVNVKAGVYRTREAAVAAFEAAGDVGK